MSRPDSSQPDEYIALARSEGEWELTSTRLPAVGWEIGEPAGSFINRKRARLSPQSHCSRHVGPDAQEREAAYQMALRDLLQRLR